MVSYQYYYYCSVLLLKSVTITVPASAMFDCHPNKRKLNSKKREEYYRALHGLVGRKI